MVSREREKKLKCDVKVYKTFTGTTYSIEVNLYVLDKDYDENGMYLAHAQFEYIDNQYIIGIIEKLLGKLHLTGKLKGKKFLYIYRNNVKVDNDVIYYLDILTDLIEQYYDKKTNQINVTDLSRIVGLTRNQLKLEIDALIIANKLKGVKDITLTL